MKIEYMMESHLDEIPALDKQCFGRDDMRKKENIHALWEISQGGAFVGCINEEIIAYVFTHRYGLVGTIGPLGVLGEYRNRGYGQQIINYAIDYLKQCGCNVIGLEVLPDKIKNIGLYLKLGFRFVQPTLLFTLKPTTHSISNNCISGDDMPRERIASFCTQFQKNHSGYNLEYDIDWIMNHNPKEIIFYQQEQEIKGFMSYSPHLYKFIFGYISKDVNLSTVLYELYNAICLESGNDNLKLRINAKYHRFLELLSNEVSIENTIMRMELCSEQIPQMEDDIVMRSWIG